MQRVKGIELDLIHPMSNQPSNLISTPTRDSICILPVLRMHAFLCWQMLSTMARISKLCPRTMRSSYFLIPSHASLAIQGIALLSSNSCF